MSFNSILERYDISELKSNGHNHVITALDRDYSEILELQYELNDYVYNNPEERFYILTSHPTVLTMGRGLQRDMIQKHGLVEFEKATDTGDIPVVMVKRGGGLTFHHPGQIIFYPIIHLSHNKLKTMEFINNIFALTKDIIETEVKIDGLYYNHELLGLWHGHKKVASIGVQLKKFVTLHGLALNVTHDEKLQSIFNQIFPCGISGASYTPISELGDTNYNGLINSFQQRLLTWLL